MLHTLNRYFMEFLGTFLLTLTICLSGHPLAIGMMLMALVYIGAHVSGAHYNPAVTLAFFIREKISLKEVPCYFLCQIAGVSLAAWLFFILSGRTFVPAAAPDLAIWQILLLEGLFSFIFCSVVITIATTRKLSSNDVYGIVIGLTLFACSLTLGPTTGAVLNPAVALGTIGLEAVVGIGSSLNNLWVYLVATFIGGALSGLIYRFLNPTE